MYICLSPQAGPLMGPETLLAGPSKNTFQLRAHDSISRFVGWLVHQSIGWSQTNCSEHATYGDQPCLGLILFDVAVIKNFVGTHGPDLP